MDGDKNEQKTQGVELKGGHEPAKIVGGRRIVTRDRHSESEDKAPAKKSEQTEEEKEEFGEDKPVKQSVSCSLVKVSIAKYSLTSNQDQYYLYYLT